MSSPLRHWDPERSMSARFTPQLFHGSAGRAATRPWDAFMRGHDAAEIAEMDALNVARRSSYGNHDTAGNSRWRLNRHAAEADEASSWLRHKPSTWYLVHTTTPDDNAKAAAPVQIVPYVRSGDVVDGSTSAPTPANAGDTRNSPYFTERIGSNDFFESGISLQDMIAH